MDVLMIAVEPANFLVGHQGNVDAVGVDWNKGEGVEAIELTVFGLYILCNDHRVFGADTMAAFGVDAWFDGDEHAFLQSDGAVTEVRRCLMDIEEVADTMSGTAAVVETILPYLAAADGIQIRAGRTCQELLAG